MSTLGVFSTLGDIMSTLGVFSTLGVIRVHWGDIKLHVGGYHEYTRVCSVHWRDTISTPEGYHEYTGGIP